MTVPNDRLCIFDFLESEAHCTPKQKDEVIASNLYLVSFPNSLGIVEGTVDTEQRNKMLRENDWLKLVIPDSEEIFVLDFDIIKDHIDDYRGLKSCDAFFYEPNPAKCFLIEFKATTKDNLIKMLDLRTDSNEALIKKVAHSKTILERVCFDREQTCENLVSRTHIVIVYDGKNTAPSSLAVRSLLPQKKRCTSNGKQKQASFQGRQSKKEIDQPTKRFADYVQQNLGFCSVTKKEFPGSANPDNNPRFTTFMTAHDYSKAVNSLFRNWNWGDYLPYFTRSLPDLSAPAEKVPVSV